LIWQDFLYPAGEDIPVLLQQAPKSLGQGSATVLRGLLDPELEGKITWKHGRLIHRCIWDILIGGCEVSQSNLEPFSTIARHPSYHISTSQRVKKVQRRYGNEAMNWLSRFFPEGGEIVSPK
jgi:hypothetical protein